MPRAGPLRYWSFTLSGVLLALATIAVFDWGSYHLAHTGSCASGGPYVSAQPCSKDTALHIWAVVVGPFVGCGAVILLALRGSPGGSRRIGLDSVLWAILCCSFGATALYAAFGPDGGSEGGKLAAVATAALFMPMGLAPLVFSTARRTLRRRPKRLADRIARGEASLPTIARPAPSQPIPSQLGSLLPAPPPAATSTATPIERLQRLGALKDKGLITGAEFEAHKKRILGGV